MASRHTCSAPASSGYALYRFTPGQPPTSCDFTDASHLVGTVREARVPADGYTYYLSKLDRWGNESEPVPVG